MSPIINLGIAVVTYFSKNGGLNTISGGFLGAFGALFGVALTQTSEIDQLITWVMNQGENGLIAGSIIAAARVGLATYRAAKK